MKKNANNAIGPADSNSISKDCTDSYDEALDIIDRARRNTFRAVNRELISMYWDIGKLVSTRVKNNGWGKSVVSDLSNIIQSKYLGIKGFSPQNIWRMKQFYESYVGNEKLSALLREISWTNNLTIMSRTNSDEEREFYLLLTKKNGYSSRELERQIDSRLFERTTISDIKNSAVIAKSPGLSALRDSYVLNFWIFPLSTRRMNCAEQ